MSTPLIGTVSASKAIARVKYSHDAMIDLILTSPNISQNEIAEHFGYTVPWVSRVFCSDAFNARLAERKTELIDPTIVATIEEKFKTLATLSLDTAIEHIATTKNVKSAFQGIDLAQKALGLGVRPQNIQLQQNLVVRLPEKSKDSASWLAEVVPS